MLCRRSRIITTKWQRRLCTYYVSSALTEHYPFFHPNHAAQPLEVHRSKISLTRARAGYDYPTIRLPFAFSRLIGLSTRIYQTVHNGSLAFLVVISPNSADGEDSPNKCENPVSSTDAPRLDMAEVAGSNPAEPIVLFTIGHTKAVKLATIVTL